MKENKGLIFDIQRFSIHDGPGIRTIVFLKGCPLRCLWCANPESQRGGIDLFYIPSRCIRCDACFEACGHNAIQKEDYTAGRVIRDNCTLCGACVEVCPTSALSLKGQWMSTDKVVEEVMLDHHFFQSSGGGVTLSGGEPFFQGDFTLQLLKEMHKVGLDTAVETSGCAEWKDIESCLKYIDHLLFDIKAVDPQEHKRFTGTDNNLIRENFERLVSSGMEMFVRMTIIPGINDSTDSIRALAEYLASVSIKAIELLPYHELGVSKYEYLNRAYKLNDCNISDAVQAAKNVIPIFLQFGIEAFVN